jgi:hypothetical protein
LNNRQSADDGGVVVVVVIGGPVVPLGACVITPGALEECNARGIDPCQFLARHECGDWGDLDAEDTETNDDALRHGGRLLSAYKVDNGLKLWVITEWDRSVTTILLPEEY